MAMNIFLADIEISVGFSNFDSCDVCRFHICKPKDYLKTGLIDHWKLSVTLKITFETEIEVLTGLSIETRLSFECIMYHLQCVF